MTPDHEARTREILRAVADGAQIISEILPRSSYETVSNVRRFCVGLVKNGLLTSRMLIASRRAIASSAWSHGPRSHHFELTPLGRQRLAELEGGAASATRIQA